MLGLAIGISNVGETLPRPVYALLSGLNAATVGIIALAAVQLAQKAITDKLTRLLVFLGAAAGLLYNALWYFPLLMLAAGIIAVVHDFRWLHGPVKWVAALPKRITKRSGNPKPKPQQHHQTTRSSSPSKPPPPQTQAPPAHHPQSPPANAFRPLPHSPSSRRRKKKTTPPGPFPLPTTSKPNPKPPPPPTQTAP
jgi:hypothetical protein